MTEKLATAWDQRFSSAARGMRFSAIRRMSALIEKPGIISFAPGQPSPDTFPVDAFRTILEEVLAREGAGSFQYILTRGLAPLLAAIREYAAAKGIVAAASEVLVTEGSQQGLDLVARVLIDPGDVVLVERPSYIGATSAFRAAQARMVGVRLGPEGLDLDHLRAQYRAETAAGRRVKFLYVIPSFQNPSGISHSLSSRRALLEVARELDLLVVEDDPYGDLYFGAAPPPSLLALSKDVPGSRELLAHCGSLSKVLSPGLRVGWMVAPPELLAKATMCKQFSDAHTSTFAQATAARYLKSGRMPETLKVVRKAYGARAQAMGEALKKELGDAIAFTQPQGGLFFWARLTGAGGKVSDAAAFAKRAIDKGVAFVPGTPFYAANPDPATLRLSFATADVEKIREGVARLGNAL